MLKVVISQHHRAQIYYQFTKNDYPAFKDVNRKAD